MAFALFSIPASQAQEPIHTSVESDCLLRSLDFEVEHPAPANIADGKALAKKLIQESRENPATFPLYAQEAFDQFFNDALNEKSRLVNFFSENGGANSVFREYRAISEGQSKIEKAVKDLESSGSNKLGEKQDAVVNAIREQRILLAGLEKELPAKVERLKAYTKEVQSALELLNRRRQEFKDAIVTFENSTRDAPQLKKQIDHLIDFQNKGLDVDHDALASQIGLVQTESQQAALAMAQLRGIDRMIDTLVQKSPSSQELFTKMDSLRRPVVQGKTNPLTPEESKVLSRFSFKRKDTSGNPVLASRDDWMKIRAIRHPKAIDAILEQSHALESYARNGWKLLPKSLSYKQNAIKYFQEALRDRYIGPENVDSLADALVQGPDIRKAMQESYFSRHPDEETTLLMLRAQIISAQHGEFFYEDGRQVFAFDNFAGRKITPELLKRLDELYEPSGFHNRQIYAAFKGTPVEPWALEHVVAAYSDNFKNEKSLIHAIASSIYESNNWRRSQGERELDWDLAKAMLQCSSPKLKPFQRTLDMLRKSIDLNKGYYSGSTSIWKLLDELGIEHIDK